MLPEDEKRLKREADIARSVRGPDFSRLEAEIANAKTEHAEKAEAGREYDARRAQVAALKRAMDHSVWLAPAREQDRERDDDSGR